MDINIKPLDTLVEAAKTFLQKVITPPVEELGLLFTDKVRFWRFKNQVAIVSKADKYLKEKNIKTRKVSLKVLAPMLEESSLEEEQSLQEKWVALFVNTVREDSKINTTLYSHILSQLTLEDAQAFQIIYDYTTVAEETFSVKVDRAIPARDLYAKNNSSAIVIDNLLRLRLIEEIGSAGTSSKFISLTHLGFSFMQACVKKD